MTKLDEEDLREHIQDLYDRHDRLWHAVIGTWGLSGPEIRERIKQDEARKMDD